MTLDECRALIRRIVNLYPHWKPLAGAVDEWHVILEDVPAELAAAAVTDWVTSGEGFAPSCGHVRKAAMELVQTVTGTGIPDEAEAHEVVVAAIRRVGMYGHPEWPHPAIGDAVAAFGGWAKFCQAPDDGTTRAQFRDYYRAAVERYRRRERVASLPPQAKDALAAVVAQIGRPMRELDQ